MSDLVNTMNVGNELDSGLSRLSRHSHIVLTELPTEISFPTLLIRFSTIQDIHSRGGCGSVHGSSAIGFAYCTSFSNAFENLRACDHICIVKRK